MRPRTVVDRWGVGWATYGEWALVMLVELGVLAVLIPRASRDGQPLALLCAVPAIPAMLLRERRPLAALALSIGVLVAAPGEIVLLVPALFVLYAISTVQSRSRAAAGGLAVAIAGILANLGWGSPDAADHVGLLYRLTLSIGALCATAVALGLYVGARRRVFAALSERAERADREQALLAERAVAEERIRIAQELHDVVAHDVSLMVVQAQALGATVADKRVAHGTRAIADLGRDAIGEMQRTLRLLRTTTDAATPLAPQPGLTELGGLIEQSRSAGLEIDLKLEGKPRQIPPGAELSAYRIIQESLTNVIKHAPGAPTTVTLAYAEQALVVTIVNEDGGERETQQQQRIGGGHGLLGMQERAATFGGTLTAEPHERGFAVTVTLPYGGAEE
jgi:signal transduction histidine kinase